MATRINTAIHKKDAPIIFFDGHCGFCCKSVHWLIRIDKAATFRFTAIQSETGRHHYQQLGLDPENIDTFLLIKAGKAYLKSDAVLEIAKTLGGFWSCLAICSLIPRPIRDRAYDLIAKYRLRLMGRHQKCMQPSEQIRERFLD